jgi:hypothetical protein
MANWRETAEDLEEVEEDIDFSEESTKTRMLWTLRSR